MIVGWVYDYRSLRINAVEKNTILRKTNSLCGTRHLDNKSDVYHKVFSCLIQLI